MPKLGLIAGSGRFPLLLADAAQSQGWEIVLFAVKGEVKASDFEDKDYTAHWLRPEQIGRLIELLHEEKITDVVMAGKVHKQTLYGDIKPDERAIRMYLRLKNTADDTLLGVVANELESEGIKLHPSTFCIKELLASEGALTGSDPTSEQLRDIRFGWRIAKEIGRLDIGQTVVIKGAAVMAVEAIEGTNEAIRRGGELGGEGAVVVKVAKPQQDPRFDMPAVGMNTIEVMKEVSARVLAIEAGWTVLLDREEMLEAADRSGIVVVSYTNPPGGDQD